MAKNVYVTACKLPSTVAARVSATAAQWSIAGVRMSGRLVGFGDSVDLRLAISVTPRPPVSASRVGAPAPAGCLRLHGAPATGRPTAFTRGGEGVAGEDGGEGATRQGREGVTEGFGSGEKQLLGGGGEGSTNVRMLY